MDVCPKCERIIPEDSEACPHCSAGAVPAHGVPETREATPPSPGLDRREVIMMVAAVVVGGAITMAALSRSGKGDAAAAMPSVTTPAASGPVAEAGDGDRSAAIWVENGALWLGTARKGIAFELAARNETQVWMKTVRPVLVVRCIDRRADVFVFTDSAAAMEAQDEDHAVRLQVDDQPERLERWPDSSAHDALFAPDGRQLLAELSGARVFTFGYTPHNAAPVTMRFDVGGLRDRLGAAARHCQP